MHILIMYVHIHICVRIETLFNGRSVFKLDFNPQRSGFIRAGKIKFSAPK